jgi:hypothetical protein
VLAGLSTLSTRRPMHELLAVRGPGHLRPPWLRVARVGHRWRGASGEWRDAAGTTPMAPCWRAPEVQRRVRGHFGRGRGGVPHSPRPREPDGGQARRDVMNAARHRAPCQPFRRARAPGSRRAAYCSTIARHQLTPSCHAGGRRSRLISQYHDASTASLEQRHKLSRIPAQRFIWRGRDVQSASATRLALRQPCSVLEHRVWPPPRTAAGASLVSHHGDDTISAPTHPVRWPTTFTPDLAQPR